MALAVLAAGGLRAALPSQLRSGDARWVFIDLPEGLGFQRSGPDYNPSTRRL